VIESTGAPRYAAKVKAPFAMLGLRTNDHALTSLTYLPLDEPAAAAADRIALLAVRELERYLEDPDFRFTVPLAPAGTPFQLRVWAALSEIPRGTCQTYGDVARVLRTAPRAVGQACGANRIALVIPCHRVVGGQGSLGGFMHARDGDPLAIKRWLLAHEGLRFGG
jgi:methylated-DNA-[protein]-cysteine S-methyltransferase